MLISNRESGSVGVSPVFSSIFVSLEGIVSVSCDSMNLTWYVSMIHWVVW